MTIILRPKIAKSVMEVVFVGALWSIGVFMSEHLSIGWKIAGAIMPLLIPSTLVGLIASTRVWLTDEGDIQIRVAGFLRQTVSVKDVLRYDDGYLLAAAFRGLGAGHAFIVTHEVDGRSSELRFSTKNYDRHDIENLKKFIDKHRDT